MSKSLEALKEIALWGYQDNEGDFIIVGNQFKDDFKKIKKELKAVEIIRKYGLIRYIEEWDCIGTKGYAHDLPQDVVDLLKEVLL